MAWRLSVYWCKACSACASWDGSPLTSDLSHQPGVFGFPHHSGGNPTDWRVWQQFGKNTQTGPCDTTEVAGMSSAFWCWTRTLTYPRGFTQRHTGVPNKAEGERIWWYLQPLYSNIFPFLVFWGLFMYRSSYMKRRWEDVSSGSVHHGSSERNAPGPLCVFMDVFLSFKSFYLCRCTRRRFL